MFNKFAQIFNFIIVPFLKNKIYLFSILKIIANTKPYGFRKFNPGPGVGGHCIPIDPEYLYWKSSKLGYKPKFIKLSSKVNKNVINFITKDKKRSICTPFS